MKYVMIYEDSKAEMQSCNDSKHKWVDIYTDFSEDSSPDPSVDNVDEIIGISALERMSTLQSDELNVSEETTRDKQDSEETTRDDQEEIELVLSNEDLQSILLLLKADSAANKNCQWDSRNTDYIRSAVSTAENLANLRDVDLKVMVRYFRTKLMTDIKVYSQKSDKITKLCKLLGLESSGKDLVSRRKSRTHNP